ncbi:MAG TPA: hypothetical protein VF482_04790, partial [Trebonia sp.]
RGIGALFTALTHPPRRLRRKAAASWPGGTALSAAIWPAAILAQLALIALFQLLAHQLNGSSFTEALAMVGADFRNDLSAAQVVLIEILVLLVNWPLLAPLWMRIWTPVPSTRQRFAPYLVSALVPAALAAGTVLPAQPEPTPPGVVQPTPVRTEIVDSRPWAGRPLPVQLRFTQVQPLQQISGPPEWMAPAVSWLGPGIWRAEADGRISFANPAGRTDFRPSEGIWFRTGEVVTFWLAVDMDVDGRPVTTEISGEINLTTTTMNAMWMPKITSGDPLPLLAVPSFQISTTVSVDPAP